MFLKIFTALYRQFYQSISCADIVSDHDKCVVAATCTFEVCIVYIVLANILTQLVFPSP